MCTCQRYTEYVAVYGCQRYKEYVAMCACQRYKEYVRGRGCLSDTKCAYVCAGRVKRARMCLHIRGTESVMKNNMFFKLLTDTTLPPCYLFSLCLSVSVSQSLCLSVCLSVCLCLCLSLSLPLPLCLSLSLCVGCVVYCSRRYIRVNIYIVTRIYCLLQYTTQPTRWCEGVGCRQSVGETLGCKNLKQEWPLAS